MAVKLGINLHFGIILYKVTLIILTERLKDGISKRSRIRKFIDRTTR